MTGLMHWRRGLDGTMNNMGIFDHAILDFVGSREAKVASLDEIINATKICRHDIVRDIIRNLVESGHLLRVGAIGYGGFTYTVP